MGLLVGLMVAVAFLTGVLARDLVTPTPKRWYRDGKALERRRKRMAAARGGAPVMVPRTAGRSAVRRAGKGGR